MQASGRVRLRRQKNLCLWRFSLGLQARWRSRLCRTNIQRPSGREAASVLNQQLVWVGVGFDGSRPNLVPEFLSVGGLIFSLPERAR